VTGGAGFIGCNIADRFARQGHEVIVFDALSRPGVERNLRWLKDRHDGRIVDVIADVRDEDEVARVVAEAGAIFHLAAQVAVTSSLVDPREDFDINVRGTLNVLDSVRLLGRRVPLIFASTNKVYGDLGDLAIGSRGERYEPDALLARRGMSEARPLDFHTPYGCSKGAADQYVLDYARSFGVPTVVMRMSCIYGQRQMGTEDQGWVAHFLIRALSGEPIAIYGDGCQVRDVLDVGDAVEAYVAAWERIDDIQGRAFNLGGGPSNAISLNQLVTHMEDVIGRPVETTFSDWRAGDQRYYVSDTRLVRRELDLRAPTPWKKGVAALARWLREERAVASSTAGLAAPRTAEALS